VPVVTGHRTRSGTGPKLRPPGSPHTTPSPPQPPPGPSGRTVADIAAPLIAQLVCTANNREPEPTASTSRKKEGGPNKTKRFLRRPRSRSLLRLSHSHPPPPLGFESCCWLVRELRAESQSQTGNHRPNCRHDCTAASSVESRHTPKSQATAGQASCAPPHPRA
jgi:hypothetical protein